ncbi:hypothetical protein ACROYT_G001759 [Oculina patagonica]
MHKVAARSKSIGYVLSLGPAVVFAMLRSYGALNETPFSTLLLVSSMVDIATYTSSLANPLIYAYYNKDFRLKRQTRTRWAVSPWRPCSKTCGPGLQYRSVTCMHQTRDGTTEESSSHLCPSDKPSGVQNCIKKACHLNWMAGPWSQCHGLCDVGYRLRKVRCPVEGKCAHREKPRTRKPCFKGSCYDWTTGKWGSCSAGCGSGMQSRPVTCTHRLTGKTGNTCNAGSKPATARECKLKECKEIDVVLETVCFKDKYSSKQCQAVVKYNLCSTRAWLDLCCKTCQDAGRL